MELVAFILIPVAILLIAYIYLYNSLIAKKNAVETALASVDVYLKQRHDLIPNLISATKEYMKYERELLERIVELRSKAIGAQSEEERFKVEGELSGLLQRLVMSFENYPQLRASENFLQLQASLNEVEEKIAASRRFYNSAVNDYNNALEMFPSNLIAKQMGLTKRPWFTVPEEEKQVPNVAQLFNR